MTEDGSWLAPTEAVNTATRGLDAMESAQLVSTIVSDQHAAVETVASASAAIALAVDAIAERLRAGGRLHYFGAGTSGRLAFLDAAEWPPTFGTAPELVQAHIAGGLQALLRSVEGAEDDAAAGMREAREHVRRGDAAVGISASGGAAYVVAAIESARALGALTVAIANAGDAPLVRAAERAIVLETGAEVLSGSTRLKAGTAQKLALNAISTAVMVRLGRVYDNLMVDLIATNEKLRARARRLVTMLVPTDADAAQSLLAQSGGNVKVAVVMGRLRIDAATARQRLANANGFLRAVIAGEPT